MSNDIKPADGFEAAPRHVVGADKHDQLRARVHELRRLIARERATPDQPSCVETAYDAELRAILATLAAEPTTS